MNSGVALRVGLHDNGQFNDTPIILDGYRNAISSKAIGARTYQLKNERMGLEQSKASEANTIRSAASARPPYLSRTSSSATSESSFSSAQSPPQRDPLDMDYFPISRYDSVGQPSSRASTTSSPHSVRTNSTALPSSAVMRTQAHALFGELAVSEPGSMAAAVDLVNYVGAERASDVSVCLRTLAPFLPRVDAGENGRGRHLMESDLRVLAQKHIFRVIKLYATKKMKSKGLSRRQGKSKEEVAKKLDLLEVQFATADMLELFSLARRVLDLRVGDVRASDAYSTRSPLHRASSSIRTTATASSDNASERRTSPLAAPPLASEAFRFGRIGSAEGLGPPAQNSRPRNHSPFSSWSQSDDIDVVDEEDDAATMEKSRSDIDRLPSHHTPMPQASPLVEAFPAPSSQDAILDAIRLLQENGLMPMDYDASDLPRPSVTGRSHITPVSELGSLDGLVDSSPHKIAIAKGPSNVHVGPELPDARTRRTTDPSESEATIASFPLRQRLRVHSLPSPPQMPLPPVPGASVDNRDDMVPRSTSRTVIDGSKGNASPRIKRHAVFLDGDVTPVMVSEFTTSRLRTLYIASNALKTSDTATKPVDGVSASIPTTTLQDTEVQPAPVHHRGIHPVVEEDERDGNEFVLDGMALGDDRFSTLFFDHASMRDTGDGLCTSTSSVVDGGSDLKLWTPVLDPTQHSTTGTPYIEEGNRALSTILGMEMFGAEWAHDELVDVKEQGTSARP